MKAAPCSGGAWKSEVIWVRKKIKPEAKERKWSSRSFCPCPGDTEGAAVLVAPPRGQEVLNPGNVKWKVKETPEQPCHSWNPEGATVRATVSAPRAVL